MSLLPAEIRTLAQSLTITNGLCINKVAAQLVGRGVEPTIAEDAAKTAHHNYQTYLDRWDDAAAECTP